MNITYLFGAGASAQAVPVVNKMAQSIAGIVEMASSEDYKLADERCHLIRPNFTLEQLRLKLIEDLKWLREKCESHASIDTFAKKLFLQKKFPELDKLRYVLSAYFTLVQLDKSFDKRYDSFYASLLKQSTTSFPPNIRILSWNYDYQFERVYSDYCERSSLQESSSLLNIKHPGSNLSNTVTNEFAIFKLNGTAQIKDIINDRYVHWAEDCSNAFSLESLKNVVIQYAQLRYSGESFFCNLKFAWDENSKFIQWVTESVANTEILIVIGYSFPFFNREIDRRIINSLPNLRKIYFQSPESLVIKERFQSVRSSIVNMQLVPYDDCHQFLLPNEL